MYNVAVMYCEQLYIILTTCNIVQNQYVVHNMNIRRQMPV